MKSSGKKKINRQTKIGENVPNLEVVEVVLVQCNLVDNECQQKSEVLYNNLEYDKCWTKQFHVFKNL